MTHVPLWPIAVTMILSSITVVYVKSSTQTDFNGFYKNADNNNSFEISLINALIIVGLMVLLTNTLLLLLRLEYTTILKGYILITTFLTFAYLGGLFWITVLERVGFQDFDVFQLIFIIWNISATGCLAILYKPAVPNYLTQYFQIYACVLLTWNLSHYNQIISWILIALLVVYDCFAVLSPCGALNQVARNYTVPEGLMFELEVETTNTVSNANRSRSGRDITNDVPPVSASSRGDFRSSNTVAARENDYKTASASVPAKALAVTPVHDDEIETTISTIKLGLGDFIFFSLLASLGARHSIISFFVTSFLILVGFYITCLLLQIFERPLPALPIPLILGSLGYVVVFYADYIQSLNISI